MPVIELEVGEDGSIAKVPEPVQKLIDKAFGKAKAEALDEARKASANPVELERIKSIESENSRLKEAEAKRKGENAEAEKIRNERHAAELADRDDKLKRAADEVSRRTQRLTELVSKEIRAVAMAAGARKESLDELEVLLGGRIGLDDALQVFVKDAKDVGKAALDKDGKPVGVEGFVTQYLTDHPHHKAKPDGRGGGAGGGRSLSGSSLTGLEADKAADLEEVARNPNVNNVARAFARIGKSA